ncbi:MAG: hypothetical protein HKM05_00650 [Spirochaetales bacterium]|nr:hypothetical protein [Spirochaetales bacterium]
MRINFLWIVFLTGFASTGWTQEVLSRASFPNQGLAVIERFTGPCKLDVTTDVEAKAPDPMVIRSQADFEKFVALLPSQDIDKNGPTGPTHNALALNPQIDWSHFMLLVVFDSQTLVFPPNISHVVVNANKLLAYVEYPDTRDLIEGKPMRYGAYGAALVAQSPLPVQWINPGPQNTIPKRVSPMILDLGPGTE